MSAALPAADGALERFAQAAHDHMAWAEGRGARWKTVREPTRQRWREAAGSAAIAARASQFSPLAGELLADAPPVVDVMAQHLAAAIDGRRTRATTPSGLRRARRAVGGRVFTTWRNAVACGANAVAAATQPLLATLTVVAAEAGARPEDRTHG